MLEALAQLLRFEPPTPPAPPGVPPCTVLVAAGDEPRRAHLQRLLRRGLSLPLHPVPATTGAQVLALLQPHLGGAAGDAAPPAQAVDVLLLDDSLPDISAAALLADLAAQAAQSPCPVVVVLAEGADEPAGRALLRAGAQDYIGIDWLSAPGLARALENAMERWRLARDLAARERELHSQRERLRHLSDNLPDSALYQYTTDGGRPRFLYISSGIERLCGVRVDDVLRDADTLHALILPAHRERMAAREAHSQRTLDDFEIEAPVRLADGRERWMHLVARARRLADGMVVWDGVQTDITARRRERQTLAAALERAELAQEAAHATLYELWPASGEIQRAESAQAVLGHAPQGMPHDWRAWCASLHPQDAEGAVRTLQEAIARKLPEFQVEYRARHQAGHYVWLINRGRVICDAAGEVERVVGMVMDVTAQREAEAALRQSEARWRTLFEQAPLLIHRVDAAGDTVAVNPAFEQAFGVSNDALRGYNLLRSPHMRDNGMLPMLKRAFDGEVTRTAPYQFNGRHWRGPGEEPWIETTGFPIKQATGQVREVVLISQNVTERFKIERELRESQAQLARRERELRTLADNTPNILARFDRRFRHLFINRAVTRTTGREPHEYIGKTNRELGMPPEFCGRWEALLVEVFERGEPRTLDFCFEREPGPRHYSATVVPEWDADGRVVHALALLVDITEHTRSQQALADADRHKDEFLATLAHELRNPLAPLRNGLQIMRLAQAGAPAAERARLMMERQLAHMTRLVDDLSDVSRIGSGKVRLVSERVTLQACAQVALEGVRPAVEASRHSLHVALPPTPLWLDADPTRLAQVLGNLLSNAAKYTPEGGRIELRAWTEGGEAVVRVSDNGLGIPPQLHEKVFDMFAQVKRTLDRAQGGLGIGLALVRRLVEMHGGSVSADSAGLGHGSAFTVRLPLAQGEASGG